MIRRYALTLCLMAGVLGAVIMTINLAGIMGVVNIIWFAPALLAFTQLSGASGRSQIARNILLVAAIISIAELVSAMYVIAVSR